MYNDYSNKQYEEYARRSKKTRRSSKSYAPTAPRGQQMQQMAQAQQQVAEMGYNEYSGAILQKLYKVTNESSDYFNCYNAQLTQKQNQNNPIGLAVGKSKFIVSKYLSAGSFGRLYIGVHSESNEVVAIKMEPFGCDKPQLHLEYGFYKKLASIQRGVPKIFTFGPCGVWNALVMELLGPSLEKMLEQCGGKFSLRTVIQLTIQFLLMFRGIHDCGILYRDTKPANFVLGLPNTNKWWIVHVVDLGFCKEWRQDNGAHIEYQEQKLYTGTVRYMSINNNMGHEQSRRDDLEAIAYMMIFLYKGRLPWQGVQEVSLTQRYIKICEIKTQTPVEVLCSKMPDEFVQFLRSVKALGFEEKPDYNGLITLFVNLLAREYVLELNDKVYDWTSTHRIKPPHLRYLTQKDVKCRSKLADPENLKLESECGQHQIHE